jgi:hypothetical protein
MPLAVAVRHFTSATGKDKNQGTSEKWRVKWNRQLNLPAIDASRFFFQFLFLTVAQNLEGATSHCIPAL